MNTDVTKTDANDADAEPAQLSSRLAEFASSLRWEDLPASAQHATRRTWVNAIGLGVEASRHEAVQIALETVTELGLGGRFRMLGRDDRLSLSWAAFAMGIAIHVEDFDDTHLRTVIHPGAPVVPAAMAVAQLTGASGRDVLTAVAAGVELACRVGNALGPGHFDRGWHLTSTMGHLGAAAAAGRLLGLDAQRMRHALAIASTQAAGTTEQLGTMTKPLHPGKAAADGIEAALLAAKGFQGPKAPLAGQRGLGALMAPAPEPAVALEAIGETWEIEANAFKPYSCGIVSHPVIDAAIALRQQLAPGDEIESVEVTVRPVVLEVMGVEDPENGLRSKFSVYHCFAVGYLDGGAGPAQYTDERARDPEVVALRRRVRAITDPDMPKDACVATIRTARGATHRIGIDHATGSVDRPMTDDQLRSKFALLVRPRLGERAQRLLDAAWSVEEAKDLDELLTLAVW